MIDVSSLEKAIAQTKEALDFCNSELARNDARLALHLRAAAIQAFEFTYELSLKSLKRYLEETEGNPSAPEAMTFNELIRRGYALGLLKSEIVDWKEFRKDRGTTSHTYDENKARNVFETIPAFIIEAAFLLQQINTRQAKRI
jgi:nucleotidyltransferase substrate binding protein (TIGR01987 family)